MSLSLVRLSLVIFMISAVFLAGCSLGRTGDVFTGVGSEDIGIHDSDVYYEIREMPPECREGDAQQQLACIVQKAVSEGDVFLCETVFDVELGENSSVDNHEENHVCIRKTIAARKDPDLCRIYGDETERDYCIGHLAIDLGDVSICSLLAVKENVKKCRSYFESR
ncbi:hypothetical protein JW968_02145 [Candidatus Woesearchaeota archaeon]|nr:hypothetical protein [Candidatus Woesearchaeota archaeon]